LFVFQESLGLGISSKYLRKSHLIPILSVQVLAFETPKIR